jgi:flagellar biosynthesis/type III secretory pathway protein FliH
MSDPIERVLAAFGEGRTHAGVRTPDWFRDASGDVRPWTPVESKNAELEDEHDEELGGEEDDSDDPQAELELDQAALAALYDETREAAQTEGFDAGFEEGQRAGEDIGRENVEEELAALQDARIRLEAELHSLALLRRQLLADAEKQSIELAFKIGKRMAAEAQLNDTAWVQPLVREACRALTSEDRAVCKISPELAARLEEAGGMPTLEGTVFEQSRDLEPLEIVVETQFGRIDAGFEARFNQLRKSILDRVATVDGAEEVA